MDLLLYRADTDGYLRYTFGNEPQTTRGRAQLTQEVVVELLSSYDPITGRGSDIEALLSDVSSDDVIGARAAAATAVGRARGVIIARQQSNSALAANERLADLRLLSIAGAAGRWAIELELVPVSGQPTAVRIG